MKHPLKALLILTICGCASLATRTPSRQVMAAELSSWIDPKISAPLPPHPRLFASDHDLELVRASWKARPELAAWHEQLEAQAETLLAAPTIHPVTDQEDNLEEVRRSLGILTTLAGLYRLDGDARKLERARAELLAIARLPAWDSDQFLQTAELSFAAATGFDWLYPALASDERAEIARAIAEKGLEPGLKRYQTSDFWTQRNDNWNQVCNSGLGIAALAIADQGFLSLSRDILERAYQSIQLSMARFAPDGGYPEGAMYWNYGTRYAVYWIDALRTTLGADGGLGATPGLSKTGRFEMAMIDPIGLRFNYGDAEEPPSPAPEMFWFARAYGVHDYLEHELRVGKPTIFHLLWATHQDLASRSVVGAGETYFRAIRIAAFRDRWDDPKSLYFAFRGGRNSEHHGHLDLGSFVFDINGERWASDLGPDDYHLPGYFGAQRFSYLRTSTRGHNTLVLDGQNQAFDALAEIVKFHDGSREPAARSELIADLTSAYPGKLKQMARGVSILHGEGVLRLQDELTLSGSSDVTWNLMTHAKVQPDSHGALMSLHHERLWLRVVEPKGAVVQVTDPSTSPGERPLAGVRSVQIHLGRLSGTQRLVVDFETRPRPSAPVVPLAKW